MSYVKHNLSVWKWAIKLAFRFSPKLFLFWLVFSIVLALLPSLILTYNRDVVAVISDYLMSMDGVFSDALYSLCILGILLILNGLSRRINSNFLYMAMYDDFYFGMEEYIMDSIQRVEWKTLMDKEYYEDYRYCEGRCGSLTDVMSQGCLLIMKSVTTVSLIAIAFSVSILMGVIATICFVITVFVNFRLSAKMVKDMYAYRGANAESKYYADEMRKPGVAKEMRIYQNQEKMLGNWKKAYQVVQDYDSSYDKSRLRRASVVSGCMYVAIFLMLLLSIEQVVRGIRTVDVFLMLYLLGENLTEVNKQFSEALFQTMRGFHALKNQYNFFKSVPMDREDVEPSQDMDRTIHQYIESSDIIFSAEDLSFSYDGVNEILHKLNFEIRKGETVALVGINGSGKSTLVKLLIQLYQPDSGKLLFCGKNYEQFQPNVIRQQIGMFFQNFYLYHLTLRENIGFGNIGQMDNDEAIYRAIDKGGAQSVLSKCKEGLLQILGREVIKNGLNLSGGEKQRIAVSRVHMSERDILIFDEPAAALDPIAEMEQFRNIREKCEGKTSILISHRVGFARIANRILVMDQGRLVEIGTHEELLQKNGVYAKLFAEQAQWYEVEEEVS